MTATATAEPGRNGTARPAEPLLRVSHLRKYFPVTSGLLQRTVGYVRAVDDVSFTIDDSETFALVGESGCGKTTTSRLILRLETPTSGTVELDGQDVHKLQGVELRKYRTSVQTVFQDPWGSLNPRWRVRDLVSEALVVNARVSRAEVHKRVASLLVQVGLHPEHANLFPHEFSGGQRQRLAVAGALIANPRLIVLDEPVSALDVSVQAQVMNLLKEIQDQRGVAYLLVAHNLATVRYLAHRVGVMYLGELVEVAPTEAIFAEPLHPYTKALFSAALPTHPDARRDEVMLEGEVPSPMAPPSGCRFHTRCPFVMDVCQTTAPVVREVAPGHLVGCHLYTEGAAVGQLADAAQPAKRSVASEPGP
jgi:oligopeptide/dipeptide ABC transporter ATP-binding protein